MSQDNPMHSQNLSRITKWFLVTKYIYIALVSVSGILLVPFYLKFIPLELYGAWMATGNVLAWISVLDPGLAGVLQQRIAEAYGKGNWKDLGNYVSSGMTITALIAVVVIIFTALLAPLLPVLINLPTSVDQTVLNRSFTISAVGAAVSLTYFILSGINLGLQGGKEMGIRMIIAKLVEIVVTVFLLINQFGLLSIPLGFLAGSLLNLIYNIFYLFRRLRSERIALNFSVIYLSELSRLMFFTFMGRIGGTIAKNIDKVIIARYLGVQFVPLLAFTEKAPVISKMLVEQPGVAIMPAVSHLVGQNKTETLKKVTMRLLLIQIWIVGLLFGGFLAFNKDFVTLWVGEQFYAGGTVNIAICLSIVVVTLGSSFSNLSMSLGNIKGNGVAKFIEGFVYIPLIFLGVKNFGLLGVVLAQIISSVLVSCFYFFSSYCRLLALSNNERYVILQTLVKTLFIAIILSILFGYSTATNWFNLLVYIGLFAFSYILIVFILFRSARSEISNVIFKISQSILNKKYNFS